MLPSMRLIFPHFLFFFFKKMRLSASKNVRKQRCRVRSSDLVAVRSSKRQTSEWHFDHNFHHLTITVQIKSSQWSSTPRRTTRMREFDVLTITLSAIKRWNPCLTDRKIISSNNNKCLSYCRQRIIWMNPSETSKRQKHEPRVCAEISCDNRRGLWKENIILKMYQKTIPTINIC